MKNITLSGIACATALGAVALTAPSTHAAVLTYEFQATLDNGFFLTGAPEIGVEPAPDFYKGIFSFDSSALTGIGFESLGLNDGLEINLVNDPRVDETLDPRAPEFPVVNFQDGELLGLDWLAIYHPFTAVAELDYPGDFVRISGTELTDGFDPTFYTPEDEPRQPILGSGTVAYSQVPEPATLLGLATAALSLGAVHRRRHQAA
ncbi:MAG: PEP-CTERM sorting domain-containing protein [Cyanobacteria bacterium J06626_23]